MSRGDREVVLIRHATTADTRNGLLSGHEPTPLDAGGQQQAQAIGSRLASRPFQDILVSPIARAWETAERAGLGERARAVEALAEWRYGDLVGRPSAEVRAQDPDWTLWTHGAPGGERPSEVEARLRPVLTQLRAADGDVAVFSHGHVLRALVVAWLDLPIASAGRLVIDPGSISVLGHRHGHPVLVALNDRTHLGADDR